MTQVEQGGGWLIVATGIAILLLVALVSLRTISRGKAEVKMTDTVIALIPVVVALFATGQIARLTVGPEGVAVERTREAILEAAATSVSGPNGGLSPIEPEPLETFGKSGTDKIAEYAQRGIQGLTFQVGGSYVADIMQQYVVRLSDSPQFRFIVLVDGERFYGMIEAGKLMAFVGRYAETQDRTDWKTIERWIEDEPEQFRALSGFVGHEMALPHDTNKRVALQRLQDMDTDWLPVLDNKGRLAGTVDQARLTASLILEVAGQLEQPETSR